MLLNKWMWIKSKKHLSILIIKINAFKAQTFRQIQISLKASSSGEHWNCELEQLNASKSNTERNFSVLRIYSNLLRDYLQNIRGKQFLSVINRCASCKGFSRCWESSFVSWGECLIQWSIWVCRLTTSQLNCEMEAISYVGIGTVKR